MNKVIFLDRDGVINYERGDYTYKIDQFKIIDCLFDALLMLKKKGYQFIVITNQGGISKGIYTREDVGKVHQHMRFLFADQGLDLLDIYYCPHHSDIERCICRKPDSLLIEKAVSKYNVEKAASYFIGDSQRDIDAAKKAGIEGIKIRSNSNLVDYLNQIN